MVVIRSQAVLPSDSRGASDPSDINRPAPQGRADQLASALLPFAGVEPDLSTRYLIKNWIDLGTISIMFGESNVGKSFLALDMAAHVAAGFSWHGNSVRSSEREVGPVVYVAAEGVSGIRNRIAAIRRERPDLAEAIDARGGLYLLPVTIDLFGPNDAAALNAALRRHGLVPSMVIVDTLARAMGGGDESSARDMGAFIHNVDLVRDATKAHVMIIHHSGKDATRGARGSSSLRAAVDTEIKLSRSGMVIMAETVKQRDMPGGDEFAYSLRTVGLGTGDDGDEITSCVVEPTEPVKKKPVLGGQQLIAMQALDDALAQLGKVKMGDTFPQNRRCVPVAVWREYCVRHTLSKGESDSAQRKAFHTAQKALHEKGLIRIIDEHVWRCDE